MGSSAEVLGDELPGQRDRPLLEVVAEGEVAEHLEERVMPRRVADVVEVVVLAAGAHALLRGGGARVGARLLAGEDVLELHHAGADVNISVGSLRGTSGDDGTTSWPFLAKKSRNVDRT